MRLIKCNCGSRYINTEHIVSIYIEDAYSDGKPLNKKCVIANMTFGNGNEILFTGSLEECQKYIATL